jgi:hypothetical protein
MWTHDFKIWSITEKRIAAYLLPEKGSLQTRRRDRPPAHRGIGERPRSSTGAPTPLHFTARLRPTAIKTTRIPSCRHDKLGRVTSPIRRHATHRLVATALHLPHPTNLPTAAYGADGNGRFLRRARRQTRGSGAAPEPRRIPRPFLACLRLPQAPRQPPPLDHRRQRQRDPRATGYRAARPAQDGRLQGDPKEHPALLLRGDAGARRAGGRLQRRHRAALHILEVPNSSTF